MVTNDVCNCKANSLNPCGAEECKKKGQVRYWGTKKIGDDTDYITSKKELENRLLNVKASKVKRDEAGKKIILKRMGHSGKIKRLERELKDETSKSERKSLRIQIEEEHKAISELNERHKMNNKALEKVKSDIERYVKAIRKLKKKSSEKKSDKPKSKKNKS